MNLLLKCLVVAVFICARAVGSVKISNVSDYCGVNEFYQFLCSGLDYPYEEVEFDITFKAPYSAIYFENSTLYTIPRNVFGLVTSPIDLHVRECGLRQIFKWNFEQGETTIILNLDNNLIEIVPTGVFEHLPNLETLYLSENNIESLEVGCFSGLEKLDTLNLYENRLRDIREDTFRPLKKLTFIDLSENEIGYLPDQTFAHNPLLVFINLRRNNLKIIDPETPAALWSLADSDRVTSPGFLHLPNLEHIILSENYVPFVGRTMFSGVKTLRHMSLDATETEVVDHGAFDSLVNLKTLSLADDRLEHFETDFLKNAPLFADLDLSNNFLEYLDYKKLGDSPNLYAIVLYGNFWSCSFLEEMQDFFSSKSIWIAVNDSSCINETTTEQSYTTEDIVSLSPTPDPDYRGDCIASIITLTTLLVLFAVLLSTFCGIYSTRKCRQKQHPSVVNIVYGL